MKISKTIRRKSILFNLSNLQELIDHINSITEKEGENNQICRKRISFSITLSKNDEYTFDDPDEFKEFIKKKFRDIKGMNIRFYGQTIEFQIDFFPLVYIRLSSNDNSQLLSVVNEFESFFRETTWNNWSSSIIFIAWLVFVTIIAYMFREKFDLVDVYALNFLLMMPAALWNAFVNSFVYPSFVIRDGAVASARIFKNDLALILFLVFIPIILNILSSFFIQIMH